MASGIRTVENRGFGCDGGCPRRPGTWVRETPTSAALIPSGDERCGGLKSAQIAVEA